MHFSRDMTDAFADWLERDRIQRALIAARPGLAHTMVLDEVRPLLRIPSSDGGFIVVAKTFEGAATQWVVGVPARPEPIIHEPGSRDEIVRTVIDQLDGSSGRANDATVLVQAQPGRADPAS